MALDTVFRDQWGRVLATLAGILGDIELAEDAAAEAFAIAAERWPRDGEPANPAGWLITTARNRAIDQLRRQQVHARRDGRHLQGPHRQQRAQPASCHRRRNRHKQGPELPCPHQLDRPSGDDHQRTARAGHDPVILKGGMGAKDRAAALARLVPQPGGPPLLAVATGPHAGEGFDCPPLDTLFLAAPVASKGRLLQYAGRILRSYDGKATAEVHDYHDEQVGVLASSLAKRAPGYTSLGFPDPRRLPYTPSAAATQPVVQASRG